MKSLISGCILLSSITICLIQTDFRFRLDKIMILFGAKNSPEFCFAPDKARSGVVTPSDLTKVLSVKFSRLVDFKASSSSIDLAFSCCSTIWCPRTAACFPGNKSILRDLSLASLSNSKEVLLVGIIL